MEALKNIYNEQEIIKLAQKICDVYPSFEYEMFLATLLDSEWENLALKQRMRKITLTLGQFLPSQYAQALEILKLVHRNFSGLFHIVFPDFVEVYGIDYLDISLEALKIFTPYCTSEFAIRVFLIKYPEVINVLKEWAYDENEHVRRLASEGCRPRLPWGIALQKYKQNPNEVVKILEILKNDDSEYVRKSVANNLNDISKDNPQIAKDVFKKWYGVSPNTNKLVKKASRTLLKAGDRDILSLFGYDSIDIQVDDLIVSQKVKINDYLNFSFNISSKLPLGALRIEYKIGLIRQNNKMGYKIFMLSQKYENLTSIKIEKSHHFKKVTTRKYYAGIHTLSIIINGHEYKKIEFELVV